MRWMQKSKQEDSAPKKMSLSFCERMTASPTSPQHLRKVAPGEELKPSGGLDVITLCGTPLQGWDLNLTTREDLARIVKFYQENLDHKVGRVCDGCAEEAEKFYATAR